MTKYKICVVGLGYVGLPLSLLAAEKGNEVSGFDIEVNIVERLRHGRCTIQNKEIEQKLEQQYQKINFNDDPAIIADAEVVIVCVPTPVDNKHQPNLEPLRSACSSIAAQMKPGQLIIVESTIFPGTMEEIVLPILNKSGLTIGKDFWLAHCPERIDPGNTQHHLYNIPRVVGGITSGCTEKAAAFYRSLIDAPILSLKTIKAAETCKVVENTFRDVNIALVNELACSFDMMDIDILEVLKGAATKPFAFLLHYPGCGVGGHCIPVDPYYLIAKSQEKGFALKFLSMAREINNGMPAYTVEKLCAALEKEGKKVSQCSIAVLGAAYKANVDDVRESPALKIIELLQKQAANVDVYDPYASSFSTVSSLDAAIKNKDAIIIATNHDEFLTLNAQVLRRANIKIVIDGRNCLDKEELLAAGIVYKGIGR